MAREIVWSLRARADLRLAIEYISRDSTEAARRFGMAVVEASRSLAELSERGRTVPELGDPAVRELLLGRYRIIYEIFANRVSVVRVLHASRDLLAAWGRR